MSTANPDMLPDGSNPEGVDPVPALDWTSAADFGDVVLYGTQASPPTVKIQTYLAFYKVPHKFLESKLKPKTDYKKVPVMFVNGRQVNDSYIIVKHLVPALAGKYDEEWEEKITFQLQPSIEHSLSLPDAKRWMSEPHGFGIPCILLPFLASFILNSIKQKIEANPRYIVRPPLEVALEFAKGFGDNPFFHGDAPGQVDLSFYGTCATFFVAGCEGVRAMLQDAQLEPWWRQMEAVVPLSTLFPDVLSRLCDA